MANPRIAAAHDVEFNHRRTKSSALKTFIHKRTASKGAGLLPPTSFEVTSQASVHDKNAALPFLPVDHPYAMPLGELHQNQYPEQSSPKKPRDDTRPVAIGEGNKSLYKKSKSTVSLKSLTGKDTAKTIKKDDRPASPKKVKSTTNLATLLSRPKSSKNLKKAAEELADREAKDKENRAPPASTSSDSPSRPPIYAQFSSQAFTTQPLGGKFLEEVIDLYTPENYSPGKQRNFYEGPGTQPTLTRKEEPKRPLSTYLPSSFSIQDIASHARRSDEQPRKSSNDVRPALDRKATMPDMKRDLTLGRRGAKVMAAVAALGAKPKVAEVSTESLLEIKDVDREFETMLDRRNIPEHQRGKMRSLAKTMKIDFIKQDRAELAAAKTSRPDTRGSEGSAEGVTSSNDSGEVKKRPRSRTFTLSKASKDSTAPSKKSKPESALGRHSRTKSVESITGAGKSLTSAGAAAASTLIAKAKGQAPDDFVAYLRKVQKPELVEVGKLHKLRLLLRNETVAWTDEFISLGGMKEIVALLHRTMEVEWREEHEDALLHEVLLCLKALTTTALALCHLSTIQTTLFPALINLLFDPEHKGPSEFTTRNIITSLLFTYLKSAPNEERTRRALTLLSYLRDPKPKEEERPVPFVLQMHKERPYRIWGKEVANVTKEVFWIFLHNLNVIALPKPRSSSLSALEIDTSEFAYMNANFPPELPPVPAAPYVGGVEWDATNYLASHLDLLNGILACIPQLDERNALREQLRISGWERMMGATLRTCKEKFYGGVHAGLRTWVAAGVADGWDVRDVRCGPAQEVKVTSPRKSPSKKGEEAPRLEMPKLDFGVGSRVEVQEDAWL